MSTIYRIEYSDIKDDDIVCDIENPDGDAITPIMAADGDCIRLKTTGEENKLTSLYPTQCTIKFVNTPTVNYSTFAAGDDNSWKVTVKRNGNVVFVGWLEQDDISEPFLYQDNQVITLVANDGLGRLKDTRMVDRDGNVVNNFFLESTRLIDYISYCLFRTGLQLGIKVINNLRTVDELPGTGSNDGRFYGVCNALPKTWEDGIFQALDCWTILQRILGTDCYLKQAKGQWWIVRITELRQDYPMYVTSYGYDASYIGFGEVVAFEKAVGLKDTAGTPFAGTPDATGYFSQKKTNRILQRPVNSLRLKFKFDYPQEIPCNNNFERGDLIGDLPDETDDDGFVNTVKNYNLDCWTYQKEWPAVAQDSSIYIVRRFLDDKEKERFVRAPATASPFGYAWTHQVPILITKGDRFDISLSIRREIHNTSGSPFDLAQVWVQLYGDDGTFWDLQCTTGANASGFGTPGNYWRQAADSTFAGTPSAPSGVLRWQDTYDDGSGNGVDTSKWNQLSWINKKGSPRSGQLVIWILNDNSPELQYTDWTDFKFTYHPSMNGGFYDTFTGQSNKVVQASGIYRTDVEKQVYLADQDHLMLKGALCRINDTPAYVAVGRFFEGQQFPADDPTSDDQYHFGALQCLVAFNQMCFFDQIFRMNVQGSDSDPNDDDGLDGHPEFVHKYYIRDLESDFNLTAYQLVSQDYDIRNKEWTGTLIENFNVDRGFNTQPVTFVYDTDK